MSSSQQRIAETIDLFYTADKQSEVSSLFETLADDRERWLVMRTRLLLTSLTIPSLVIL